MPPLRCELLGPPRLIFSGEEEPVTSPLPLALLAYLALTDRPVSRDHLAELFWPGKDRGKRLHNLRQTILRLRSASGEEFLQGDGMLQVPPSAVETDVEEFRHRLRQGAVEDALSLWRGSFLEGFRRPGSWELENWVENQRTQLETVLAASVGQEARERLSTGDPRGALNLLTVPRALLPFHEGLGALEVMALAASGQPAQAEGLLARMEFSEGSEASREAEDLLEAVREQKEEVRPTRSHPPSSEDKEPSPRGLRISLSRWLVGVAAIVALILGSWAVRREAALAGLNSSAAAGQGILLCTNWAIDGPIGELFRMNMDGTAKHRISKELVCEGAWVEEAQAVFGAAPHQTPEARLLRFEPNSANPIAEWRVSEVAGARDLRAVRIPRAKPRIGAEGMLVFSAEDQEGNRDIYALNPITEAVRRLTFASEADDWPTVAPGGQRVVFTSFRSGSGDLYSVGLDGSGMERLTTHFLEDQSAWIRGDSVVFVRGRGVDEEDGNMEIMLLDLVSGEENRLTDNDWNDYEQAWSPDGRYLCWQSERLGHFESDIMVMELGTGQQWNATDTPGRESDCRWTPVGNGLLYLRFEEPEGTEVFYRSLKGRHPLNLSRYPGSEAVIGFFPLPADGEGE